MNLASVSHVLPSKVVTNEDVIRNLKAAGDNGLDGGDLDTLIEMTEAGFAIAGTAVRYQCDASEKPYELCLAAARSALDEAGLAPEDISLIIYAGIGRGFIEPATANVFQDLLGAYNSTCFDLIDACASWIRAVEVAAKFLNTGGKYQHVLIINGEFISRYGYRYNLTNISEFEHWFPGVTVGEAATATVLSASEDGDNFAFDFRTSGEKRGLCLIPLANYEDYLGQPTPSDVPLVPLQFASFGGQLLRFGASKLVSHFREMEDFRSRDYDVIFGHPASDGICAAIGRRCGLDFNKFEFTHRLYGNTASASLPLAMSTARNAGRLAQGSKVLVMFASAGVSTALARFTMNC